MEISKGSKPLMRGGAERGTRGVPSFPEARPHNGSVATVLLSTEFSSKPCSGVTLRVQPIPRKPYCVHSKVIVRLSCFTIFPPTAKSVDESHIALVPEVTSTLVLSNVTPLEVCDS
jgi:hypothetical protein